MYKFLLLNSLTYPMSWSNPEPEPCVGRIKEGNG